MSRSIDFTVSVALALQVAVKDAEAQGFIDPLRFLRSQSWLDSEALVYPRDALASLAAGLPDEGWPRSLKLFKVAFSVPNVTDFFVEVCLWQKLMVKEDFWRVGRHVFIGPSSRVERVA